MPLCVFPAPYLSFPPLALLHPPLFFKLPVWTSRGALLEGLGEVAPFLSRGSPEAIKSSGEEAGGLLVPRSPLVMI